MKIDVGKDFTRYPAGRLEEDGPYSGEGFRNRFLLPALSRGEEVIVFLDSTAGYGSSFLEEAFGGLVRSGLDINKIQSLLKLESVDEALTGEIWGYLHDEAARRH